MILEVLPILEWCLYDGAALLVEAVQVECWLLMEIQILTESLDNVFTNGIPFNALPVPLLRQVYFQFFQVWDGEKP